MSPPTNFIDEVWDFSPFQSDEGDTLFVFSAEREGTLTSSTLDELVARTSQLTGLSIPVHPDMLERDVILYLVTKGIDTRTILDCLGQTRD